MDKVHQCRSKPSKTFYSGNAEVSGLRRPPRVSFMYMFPFMWTNLFLSAESFNRFAYLGRGA